MAVEEVKDEMLKITQRWYHIGARRGAREVLEAFLNDKFELRQAKKGNLEIIANENDLAWERSLTVRVGNEKRKISKKEYKLNVTKDLGFSHCQSDVECIQAGQGVVEENERKGQLG